MQIRKATHADVDRLVEYGKQFWVQTRYYAEGVEYDLETVTNVTHGLVDNGIVLYADDEAGKPIALMLIFVAPFPMNANHFQACEWVFYVDPAYRRGGLGATLIKEAEAQLKELGVKFFTMVSLTNVTPEAANQLYKHLGFSHSETSFTKTLS